MKNIINITLCSISLILPMSAFSNSGCFPETDLEFSSINFLQSSQMTLLDFNKTLDKVYKVWAPIIERDYSKKLIFIREWNNDKVNAQATRDKKRNPVIKILGGLARHPEMTKDALALIVCHEIGHYMGGAPKKLRGNSGTRRWSSAEGPADYFASSKCLPLVFEERSSIDYSLNLINNPEIESIQKYCDSQLCKRIALAGLATTRMFASMSKSQKYPSLKSHSLQIQNNTIYKHTDAQCRLDTIVSGASCQISPKENFDNNDPKIGACVESNEFFEIKSGARAKCWFNQIRF